MKELFVNNRKHNDGSIHFVVFIIFPFSCVYFSCRANAGSDNEVISNRLAPAITTISITLCVYPIHTYAHIHKCTSFSTKSKMLPIQTCVQTKQILVCALFPPTHRATSTIMASLNQTLTPYRALYKGPISTAILSLPLVTASPSPPQESLAFILPTLLLYLKAL